MTQHELDRVSLTTNDYLKAIREALGQASQVVNVAAAMAMSAEDDDPTLTAAQQAYERLAEGTVHFVRALKFRSEGGSTPEERVESYSKARAVASFVVGELEACMSYADTAGAWMLVKGVYDACEIAKRAQTTAWEAEQAIAKSR